MKEIFVKLFDSDYKLSLKEKDESFKIIGFSISLPVKKINDNCDHDTFIENTIKEYENKFRKMIDKLIELGKISKIFHIYMVKLAVVFASPCHRFCFVCHCNDYDSNSKFEGLVEGETPPFVQIEELDEFIERLKRLITENVIRGSHADTIVIDDFS